MPYVAASGCDPEDLAQRNRPSNCPSPYGNLVDPKRKTTNATVRCSVSDQDEENVERIRGFFNWAKGDPMVAGFNPCENRQAAAKSTIHKLTPLSVY